MVPEESPLCSIGFKANDVVIVLSAYGSNRLPKKNEYPKFAENPQDIEEGVYEIPHEESRHQYRPDQS
jgi:hypothetical protein